MPETPSPLDAPVALALTVDGRMLAEVQHRPADRLNGTDTAALVATLRFAADALAEHHLGRPVERDS